MEDNDLRSYDSSNVEKASVLMACLVVGVITWTNTVLLDATHNSNRNFNYRLVDCISPRTGKFREMTDSLALFLLYAGPT